VSVLKIYECLCKLVYLNYLNCGEMRVPIFVVRRAQAARLHLQTLLTELESMASAESVVTSDDGDVQKVQKEIAAVFCACLHCLLAVCIYVFCADVIHCCIQLFKYFDFVSTKYFIGT